MTRRRFCGALAASGAGFSALRASEAPASRLHAWQRWEHRLTSARGYANPYAEVTVRVTYNGPQGRSLRGYGYWDGGNTFRLRCAFPEPGSWTWQTDCSDTANAGLHRRQGAVTVSPYLGPNRLYRHGFLKVSDNRRYLAYGDGTPFLWIGDTAWAAPMRASKQEWERYLEDRAAKHFTLVQVGPAPQWAGETDRLGARPFFDAACGQWNPAFWQAFESKIQRANERGFVVMLTGLMEPVFRYPESHVACLFARSIVARLFGNFVIFSPSFDSKFMPLGDEVGRATRDATSVHLITQHPGTPWDQPTPTYTLKYIDQPYIDFAGVQTGHNRGRREWCARNAIEWNLHLYRREPHKPVINLEAMYDGQCESAWQAVDARSLGWRSWLSGAMGYTYGAGEVPQKCPAGNGGVFLWAGDAAKYDYWEKALQWESAFQMRHMHDFLAHIEWWLLEPAHHLIRNQPEQAVRRMALARTAAGDLAVAYLPDNDFLELDMAAFPSTLTARWFDPVTGRYTPVAGAVDSAGTRRFARPAQGDWVLLFESRRYRRNKAASG